MFTGLSYASIKVTQGAIYKWGQKNWTKVGKHAIKLALILDWGLKN
jgi:hypothetical protein